MPMSRREIFISAPELAGYGKLSKQNIEDLEMVRGSKLEKKEDPLICPVEGKKSDDEIAWSSPWEWEDPAGTFECSVMSTKYWEIPSIFMREDRI